jgi:Fic family protein
VLSSQIEGTQSSLSDLLLFENDEAPGVPLNDVQEVSNYVAALNHGLDRLRGGGPLWLRHIREIHEVLLSKGRGTAGVKTGSEAHAPAPQPSFRRRRSSFPIA